MSEKDLNEVRFELDRNNLPTMSKDDLDRLSALTDDEIDYSDTPPLMGPPTRRVFGPRFGSPQDVVALEADVLEFFRESGDTSPRRINAALREYVNMHRKRA